MVFYDAHATELTNQTPEASHPELTPSGAKTVIKCDIDLHACMSGGESPTNNGITRDRPHIDRSTLAGTHDSTKIMVDQSPPLVLNHEVLGPLYR
jgi:hypothetical protein